MTEPAASNDITPVRVSVTFPAGTVTIMPRRAPVGMSDPIRGETLAVYPCGQHDEATILDHIGVVSGRTLEQAPAAIDAGAHGTMPGLAVLGLTETEATAAATGLNLPRILFWDGRRAFLVACPPAGDNRRFREA